MVNGVNMSLTSLIDCAEFVDERGVLRVVDDRALPFEIRRLFWITNVPPRAIRGHHAHRDCQQVILCLAGTFVVALDREYHVMTPSSTGLYAPAGTFIELSGFSPDAVCLVLASDYYKREDVIDDRR